MAHIAAADDDPSIQNVVKRVLGGSGHEVTMSGDGAALIERTRAEHPDVVVTDNEMPVMSGLDAIKVLHDDPNTADIPAVLASGSVSQSEAAEVLTEGDQVVSKPFTAAQLNDGVDTALAGSHPDE